MVTNLEQLKNINQEVELPPFADGTPLIAKVKRTSLINMVCDGRIPNPLVKVVLSMFDGNKGENASSENKNISDDEKIDSFKFMMAIVKDCLIEPTYQQITECGLELTDNQIMAIFSYAMGNANNLVKFCSVPGNS